MLQIQLRIRIRLPLFQAVELDAMLPKLRIAQVELLLIQVLHPVPPIAIGRSASDDDTHRRILDIIQG